MYVVLVLKQQVFSAGIHLIVGLSTSHTKSTFHVYLRPILIRSFCKNNAQNKKRKQYK